MYKNENFIIKGKKKMFLIYLLKTDCEHKLEPPRQGGSKEVTPHTHVHLMNTHLHPTWI